MMMGIFIMDNFKTPYLAKGIAEFWNRWHISLSTWFRDYLFIPLGGSRVKKYRFFLNILIVFTVSGLWHGANWTFFIWGLLHAIYYVFEMLKKKLFPLQQTTGWGFVNITSAIITFLLVSFAWIFFRSESFSKAMLVFESLFNNYGIQDTFFVSNIIWVLLGLFIILDIILYNKRFDTWIVPKKAIIRWSVYAVLLFSILALAGINYNPFIYFQF